MYIYIYNVNIITQYIDIMNNIIKQMSYAYKYNVYYIIYEIDLVICVHNIHIVIIVILLFASRAYVGQTGRIKPGW